MSNAEFARSKMASIADSTNDILVTDKVQGQGIFDEQTEIVELSIATVLNDHAPGMDTVLDKLNILSRRCSKDLNKNWNVKYDKNSKLHKLPGDHAPGMDTVLMEPDAVITTLHMKHHKVQQGIFDEKLDLEEVKISELVIGKTTHEEVKNSMDDVATKMDDNTVNSEKEVILSSEVEPDEILPDISEADQNESLDIFSSTEVPDAALDMDGWDDDQKDNGEASATVLNIPEARSIAKKETADADSTTTNLSAKSNVNQKVMLTKK